MRWLLFLSRLSFICGLFFLISLSLLVKNWITDESLVSTIITIGFFMGMIIVPLTLLCYLVLFIAGKKPGTVVPSWLMVANVFVMLILLSYIVYVNYLYNQSGL
ncbi:MAG TPA: hypothetical protein VFV31_15765 [Chitinophagaceae bacterium]|nr:hypothetical protein [Chitinophagaceae bacterium]